MKTIAKFFLRLAFCWMVPLCAALAHGMDPRTKEQGHSRYRDVLAMTWRDWWGIRSNEEKAREIAAEIYRQYRISEETEKRIEEFVLGCLNARWPVGRITAKLCIMYQLTTERRRS